MARRPRDQPSESAYGRKYNDFNNPTGGPGPVTARSPRPVQRNPMAPKSPKEFTTDIAERAAKPITMSGGIGTVLDQSRTLEIPPTFPTPLTDEEWLLRKKESFTPGMNPRGNPRKMPFQEQSPLRESFARTQNSSNLIEDEDAVREIMEGNAELEAITTVRGGQRQRISNLLADTTYYNDQAIAREVLEGNLQLEDVTQVRGGQRQRVAKFVDQMRRENPK
jgi:hypothetical protein